MNTKQQHGIVIAFSGVVTVMLSLIIAQQNIPLNISADLMTTTTMRTAAPVPLLPESDPNEVVVTITDESSDEVITYTEADLVDAFGETPDGLMMELQYSGDETVEISSKTCSAQTAKMMKIFTASAGRKGTKTYSYCKEDTMKGVLADHMNRAIETFCSNFNAKKYTKDCADGCMEEQGVQGATGSFYEKIRKYNITKIEDKTCKVVTGNSVAFTGNAFVSGDCSFIRQCVPFKSKFRDY